MKKVVWLPFLTIAIIVFFNIFAVNNIKNNQFSYGYKVSADDVLKIFSETSYDYNRIFDTYYYVYSYRLTLKYLDKACSNAWDMINSRNIDVKADGYDCEDEAMLILSLLRLKLYNPPCFIYIMWNPTSNQGHAMLACVVEKNGKLEKLYYDINCEERKGFKLLPGYIGYIIG